MPQLRCTRNYKSGVCCCAEAKTNRSVHQEKIIRHTEYPQESKRDSDTVYAGLTVGHLSSHYGQNISRVSQTPLSKNPKGEDQ